MRTTIWLALIASASCAGSPPEGVTPDSALPVSEGVVSEPLHGSVVPGDPAAASIRVAGYYNDPTRTLNIQVLANPDDLASWTTIASTTAMTPVAGTFAFAADVQPVPTEADRVRWPAGGILRLRVVDDSDTPLPIDPGVGGTLDPADTVIGVVNPGPLPGTWTYLTEKPVGSIAETQLYYATINAPATLDEFIAQFGFPTGETSALYYNSGDLAIGRDMHCRATEVPAGGMACYVRNYGIFGGDRDSALALAIAAGPPIATVAMVYTPPITAPNAVTFMVYGPDGALANEAQLDTRGDNTSVPQNCLNCHGGRSTYDATAHTATNARFLPFDPAGLEYSSDPLLTFGAQEDKFRQLNRLVDAAGPTAGITELIAGMFPLDNSPYDPEFVPPAWSANPRDARVYREVIAPYCRSCHASFELQANDPAAFPTVESVKQRAAMVVEKSCGPGPNGMPTAERTTKLFFESGARALLLVWLDQPGACAPAPIATP